MMKHPSLDIALASGPLLTAVTLLSLTAGCGSTPTAPTQPTWADVAPILRGSCAGCHGWTASDRPPNAAGVRPENTGGSLRFDFYDATRDVCGDAVLALDPTVGLAGSARATSQIGADIIRQSGARFPRMPPQPSPALPAWEIEALQRWTAAPVKGPPPPGNRPPALTVSGLPATANGQLAFTAVIDDPDGDAVIGVVEVASQALLMNRSGSFAAAFDTSALPAGSIHPIAVLCDGWVGTTVDLGPVEIVH